MEPKFQSSFIPKGPTNPSSAVFKSAPQKKGSLVGLMGMLIFIISILAAVLVFAYGLYLRSNINKMGGDLEVARSGLDIETIEEIARLDARLVSTRTLLESHTVVTPLFDFLEENTLQTVRFTQFTYSEKEEGLTLVMRGQARGYAALALQADVFNKSSSIKSSDFSDLDLDEKGNVIFLVTMIIDPTLISYTRGLEPAYVPPPLQVPTSAIDSTVPAVSDTPVSDIPEQTI